MRNLLLILLIGLFSQSVRANRDSIGVKTIGGKLYVLHKVAKGEGLYSIGRRYNVSVANIEEADPTVKDGLDPGDIVMVPSWKRGTFKTGNNTATATVPKTTPKEQPKPEVKKPQPDVKNEPAANTQVPEGKEPKYHTVKAGETLFTIAQKNSTTVADIQKWNGLKNNGITTGQKLIVGYVAATAKPEEAPKEEVEVKVGPEGSDKKVTLKQDHIDQKITKEYDEAQKKQEAERKKGKVEMKDIHESGVATWIDDGTVVSEKKLALHRTAPPGTIIQLTNPRTGRRVFVKVIGKLPDAVDEQNVQIKVTKNTAEELGAVDKFFRVDMHYAMEVVTSKK